LPALQDKVLHHVLGKMTVGVRPAQNLQVSISRLFYKVRYVGLVPEFLVNAGFICDKVSAIDAVLRNMIFRMLYSTGTLLRSCKTKMYLYRGCKDLNFIIISQKILYYIH